MTYVVIAADGGLSMKSRPTVSENINNEMPTGWWEMVRVQDQNLMAFVDESGLLVNLPRNPIGSVMLALLGAATYAYAGPVVLTGWEEIETLDDDGTELRDLHPSQVGRIQQLYLWVMAMLDGDDLGMPKQAAEVRKHAKWVETLVDPDDVPAERRERVDGDA